MPFVLSPLPLLFPVHLTSLLLMQGNSTRRGELATCRWVACGFPATRRVGISRPVRLGGGENAGRIEVCDGGKAGVASRHGRCKAVWHAGRVTGLKLLPHLNFPVAKATSPSFLSFCADRSLRVRSAHLIGNPRRALDSRYHVVTWGSSSVVLRLGCTRRQCTSYATRPMGADRRRLGTNRRLVRAREFADQAPSSRGSGRSRDAIGPGAGGISARAISR